MFMAALFTIAKRWAQTPVSIDERVDRQNVTYPYNRILFSLKKK